MTFSYRYRKAVSIVALTALMFSSTVTPATAEFIPSLGRFAQRDPNGTGLLVSPGLRYHGSNPMVTVSMAYELQYGDGMNFYEYVQSNPGNATDPSGMFTLPNLLGRSAVYGAMLGGSLGWMRSYATFSDGGSNWRQAGAFFAGAGIGTFTATAMGLLAGAISGYGGVSLGTAIASVGIMTSPTAVGLSVAEYADAQTYGERLMAGIDIGLSGLGLVASHAAAFVGPASGTMAQLKAAALRATGARGNQPAGHVRGSNIHSEFARQVKALGRSDLNTEVSYLNGKPAGYGKGGTIRVDVVEGDPYHPVAIYDLKTGGAKLRASRISEIRRHLPRGYEGIPIKEVRVEGP